MKKILCIILLVCIIIIPVSASDVTEVLDEFNIDTGEIDGELYSVREDILSDFSADTVISAMLEGEDIPGTSGLWGKITDLFLGELKTALKGSLIILGILIICSLITVMKGSVAGGEVSQVTDAVCVIAATLVVSAILKQLITAGLSSVASGVSFIKSLTPAMVVLLFTSGNTISAGALEFWIFFLLEAMAHAVEYVFIPLVCCYLALSAADAIFEGVKLSKVADLFKTFLGFSLGFMLTVFTGFITINQIVRSVGDAATSKAVKFTVSSAVPVVGKIISDAADLVISFSYVIKSAFGVFGIIAVALIFLIPIIKIGTQMVVFRIIAALSDTLGNSKLTKLLSSFATAITYVFSINICVCVFMVISLGLIVMSGVK